MASGARWTLAEPLAQATAWSFATILLYFLAKRVHLTWPRWWLMPLAVTPALLMIAALVLHVSYRDYIRGTHWLVALLGPATVAFAVPIYEQRGVIRRRWPLLLAGMIAGSLTAVVTSWALAYLLGIDGALRLSLLPRSISTPFAMEVSGEIGGIPDLTAVFVVLTGIIGAAFGDIVLARLPLRSKIAKGALVRRRRARRRHRAGAPDRARGRRHRRPRDGAGRADERDAGAADHAVHEVM